VNERMNSMASNLRQAAALLLESRHSIAFTGAGISIESGIPAFRGPNGLWAKYSPTFLDLDRFLLRPKDCWEKIREVFFDFMGKATPNPAHCALAQLEAQGLLQGVITQNIDNLHQSAGSKRVWEYHGTTRRLICLDCERSIDSGTVDLRELPPRCPHCNGILKPDFVFFGEAIPEHVRQMSLLQAEQADVILVIGTTGVIMPACHIPHHAKNHGASVIEINVAPSSYTNYISDVFLQGPAGEVLPALLESILPSARNQ
jgi:NAD-dependent deacetylase